MEESVEKSCACREMIHQFMEEFGIGGVQMGESFTKSQYRAFILTDFVQVRQSLSRYFDSHFSTGSSADDCEITHALYCLLWGEKLEPSEPSCLKTVLDPVPLPRLAQKYSGDTIFSRTEDIKNEDRFNTTFHCPANFMPFPRGSFNVQRQRSFKEGKYESFLYFAQEIEEILDNKTGPKYGAVQYLARENLNNADIEKAVNDAGLQWFYGFRNNRYARAVEAARYVVKFDSYAEWLAANYLPANIPSRKESVDTLWAYFEARADLMTARLVKKMSAPR